MRKVFIAKNSGDGLHSVIEVVPSSFKKDRHDTLNTDTLNSLIHWKTLDEMVSVLSETGPMVFSPAIGNKRNITTIDQAIEKVRESASKRADRMHCENDENLLLLQLQSHGFSARSCSKASISRDIRKHGLVESSAVEELTSWAIIDPACSVIDEPLEDIVYMRNMCAVILKIIANYQNGNAERVLEASGFRRMAHREKMRYDIPLRYDAASGLSPFLSADADVSQKEAAIQLVTQVAGFFHDLQHGNGWDIPKIPCLETNGYPIPTFHSLAAAMFGSLLFREGRIPVTCKNCGKAMMITDKHKRREFCSDSCRSQYSKEGRQK